MKKIFVFFCGLITILGISCSGTVEFERNNHADDWIEDLEIVKYELPNVSIAWSNSISKSEWEENVDKLIKDINTKTMSDIEIKYRIDEILTTIKDGHIGFNCGYDLNMKKIPIIFKVISNKEFYVSGINEEYKQYLGAKLISINDMPISDISNELMKIIPHDNSEFVYAIFEMNGFDVEQLNYLGIGKEINTFKFQMNNGNIEESKIKSIKPNEFNPIFISNEYKNKPLKYNKPDNELDQYWYKIDEANNVFYFQYNSCLDKSTEFMVDSNLPYFKDFVNDMVDYMKVNDDKFDTIVIDLRNNLGGDSRLLRDYYIRDNLEYLKEKDMKVLVGKHTFSAGISALNDLYENLDVKSYGTETGGLIGGYSYRSNMFLKNTGSSIYYSIRKTDNNTLMGRQNEEWNGFIPDIIIEDSAEDFIQGIDRVYETAVKEY